MLQLQRIGISIVHQEMENRKRIQKLFRNLFVTTFPSSTLVLWTDIEIEIGAVAKPDAQHIHTTYK